MTPLTKYEEMRRHERLPMLHAVFKHFPYAKLRRSREHMFPTLKLWPKYRSVETQYPRSWSEVSWRPISSYSRHHLKRPLAQAGRFCTHTIADLGIGWGLSAPRVMTEAVHQFNGYARPTGWVRRRKRDGEEDGTENAEGGDGLVEEGERVKMRMFDLKNFFVSVPPEELWRALEVVTEMVEAKYGKDGEFF